MFRTITGLFNKEKDNTATFTLLLVGSAVGLLASFVLSVEAITLAKNADATLPCSINAVVDCAAVGSHESASVLGFPNAFVGLMTLPVMVTIAVAGLARVKFPRWFMISAWLGALAGFGFAVWMLYMSLNVIQVLCPWCLTLDVGMILVFFAMTKYAVRKNLFDFSKATSKKLNGFVDKQFDVLLLVGVLVLMAMIIILKFGDTLWM